jgi:predicted dehydrogenase
MQRTINWGIAGSGSAASDFSAGLQHLPEARLLAVHSRNAARAQEFATRFAIPRCHESFDAIVGDSEIDVIYIATPNHAHQEQCLKALDAGKAVLCEKPFTLNAAEARVVIERARQRRLFCMEAMKMRFLPAMARVRAMVASGMIGEIRMLMANFGFTAPYRHDSRLFDPALGGGAFLDVGVYPLSLAFSFLGAPRHVFATASVGPSGVDEQAAAVLTYAGGQVATLNASLRGSLPNDAVITGTRGEIRISPIYRPENIFLRSFAGAAPSVPARPRISNLKERARAIAPLRAVYRRGRQMARQIFPATMSDGSTHQRIAFSGNGFNYEAAEVMRCLRAGECESPIMPLDQTLQIMECMDAIRQHWHADP